jgi:hypothetical protein
MLPGASIQIKMKMERGSAHPGLTISTSRTVADVLSPFERSMCTPLPVFSALVPCTVSVCTLYLLRRLMSIIRAGIIAERKQISVNPEFGS